VKIKFVVTVNNYDTVLGCKQSCTLWIRGLAALIETSLITRISSRCGVSCGKIAIIPKPVD